MPDTHYLQVTRVGNDIFAINYSDSRRAVAKMPFYIRHRDIGPELLRGGFQLGTPSYDAALDFVSMLVVFPALAQQSTVARFTLVVDLLPAV